MSAYLNPLTPHNLPWFITPPGGTDVLYTITTLMVILIVVALGVGFFWLHSLPERMGHRKLQFEVVAVLGLISLFTHMHIFWILGLILAMIDLPDVIGPQRRIARAVEKIAGIPSELEQTGSPDDEKPSDAQAAARPVEHV